MFSISKNPQTSMAEVLPKAEKYINGEETLVSKKESSSTHKEKSGTDKRRGRSPKIKNDQEGSPKKNGEQSPKRRGNLRDRLGPPQSERRRYLPQRFTPLTASVSQVCGPAFFITRPHSMGETRFLFLLENHLKNDLESPLIFVLF